jgi:hypothetical protein
MTHTFPPPTNDSILTSGSNGLYFLTLPLVCAMRVICTKKKECQKDRSARNTIGARYLSKNTVYAAELF